MHKYLLIFLIILSYFIYSCDNNVEFTYQDAKRSNVHFFFDEETFTTAYHDLDNGIIEGKFQIADKDNYLQRIYTSAENYDWQKIYANQDKIIFTKDDSEGILLCSIFFVNNVVYIKFIKF